MTARNISTRLLAPLAVALACTGAHAQLFRAYVASDGSDASPCTLVQPCRLLPAALAAVASGGEIWMLDSANYNTGTVTVGKSVSILAVPGAVGSIVAANSGPAISITASGLTVSLRNVVVAPLVTAPGGNGLTLTGASTVVVEDSLFANLPAQGISVSGTGVLRVAGTTVRGSGSYGIQAADGARAVIVSSRLIDNFVGVFVGTNPATPLTAVTIKDSIITGGQIAVACAASPLPGLAAHVSITGSTITGSLMGIEANTGGGATAEVVIGGSSITYNATGWSLSGGVLASLGNNQIHGNGASTGSLTTLAPQ